MKFVRSLATLSKCSLPTKATKLDYVGDSRAYFSMLYAMFFSLAANEGTYSVESNYMGRTG